MVIWVFTIGYCISHPAHYTPEQRTKLRECAEAAGMVVMQVVSEPAAAVLAYHATVSTTRDLRSLDQVECAG